MMSLGEAKLIRAISAGRPCDYRGIPALRVCYAKSKGSARTRQGHAHRDPLCSSVATQQRDSFCLPGGSRRAPAAGKADAPACRIRLHVSPHQRKQRT